MFCIFCASIFFYGYSGFPFPSVSSLVYFRNLFCSHCLAKFFFCCLANLSSLLMRPPPKFKVSHLFCGPSIVQVIGWGPPFFFDEFCSAPPFFLRYSLSRGPFGSFFPGGLLLGWTRLSPWIFFLLLSRSTWEPVQIGLLVPQTLLQTVRGLCTVLFRLFLLSAFRPLAFKLFGTMSPKKSTRPSPF